MKKESLTDSNDDAKERNRQVHDERVQQYLQDGYRCESEEEVPVDAVFCDMFLSNNAMDISTVAHRERSFLRDVVLEIQGVTHGVFGSLDQEDSDQAKKNNRCTSTCRSCKFWEEWRGDIRWVFEKRCGRDEAL